MKQKHQKLVLVIYRLLITCMVTEVYENGENKMIIKYIVNGNYSKTQVKDMHLDCIKLIY